MMQPKTKSSGGIAVEPIHFWFVAGCLVVFILFRASLATWLHLSWSSERYSHVIIIPLIAAVLLYGSRREIFAITGRAWDGLIFVVFGLALPAVNFYYVATETAADRLTLPILGLVAVLFGVFRTCYGKRASRAAAFPLLFLLFIVPIPTRVLDRLVEALQAGSAAVVSFLLTVFQVPFLRSGMRFDLANLSIEIAAECSGIRSSIALLIVTVLMAHAALRSNGRRLALVAAVVPSVLLKNGIRIVTLSLLAVHVDPQFLTGAPHRRGGFVFFGLMLALMFLSCEILRRSERKRQNNLNENRHDLPSTKVDSKELLSTD